MFWFKVKNDFLTSRKFGKLSDTSKVIFFHLMMLAVQAEGGELPLISELDWDLRKPINEINEAMKSLALVGLVSVDGDEWDIPDLADLQNTDSQNARRLRSMREKQPNVREQIQTVHEQQPNVREQIQTVHEQQPNVREQIQTVHEQQPNVREQIQTVHEQQPNVREPLDIELDIELDKSRVDVDTDVRAANKSTTTAPVVKKGGAAPSIAELQEKRVVQVAQKWAEKTGAKWSVFDDSYEKDFLSPIRQLMARNHSNDPNVALEMLLDERLAMINDPNPKTPLRISAVVPRIFARMDGFVDKPKGKPKTVSSTQTTGGPTW
jgi:hypothetical protein